MSDIAAIAAGNNGETLEQFADRVSRETRRALMSRLPDDVIGRLGHSHLVFGRACVIAAITIAMKEGHTHPGDKSDIVERMRQSARSVAAQAVRIVDVDRGIRGASIKDDLLDGIATIESLRAEKERLKIENEELIALPEGRCRLADLPVDYKEQVRQWGEDRDALTASNAKVGRMTEALWAIAQKPPEPDCDKIDSLEEYWERALLEKVCRARAALDPQPAPEEMNP